MKKVLIADDDPNIREVMAFALEKANFEVHEVEDGAQVINAFSSVSPDVVVLDIGMPEMDGTEVCTQLRRQSQVPIIFVSAKDSEFDRVLGLELGGDDYLTKPFSPRELVARVKSLIRRASYRQQPNEPETSKMLSHGNLELNIDTHIVKWKNQSLEFTSTEFKIVQTLLKFPGRVCTRNALMDGAYPNNIAVSDRTIDSHLRRIRSKFKAVNASPVETIHGVGYKLNSCQ